MNDLALIIGAGIGGLTTGALLTKRGWKVIILEQSSRIGGCCGTFSRSGFKFDVGATLFPDILWSGLDLVSRELGLDLDRILLDPFSQICVPGHRIGLFRDPELMKEEWSREFPMERNSINNFLDYLNKVDTRLRYLKASNISGQIFSKTEAFDRRDWNWPLKFSAFRYRRKSVMKAIDPVLKESKASAGFDLQTLFWGQTELVKSSLAYAASVIELHLYGGFCLKGGSDSLCKLLSHYIRSNGGEIRLDCLVNKVLINKRKAVGLELDTGEVLEGRCYIANTTPWGLYEKLLFHGFSKNRIVWKLRKVPYPNSVFTVFLGVKESCLPSQMGHKVFFLPSMNNGKEQTGPLFIALSPREDAGRAPDGCRAMTVFLYISPQGWNRGVGYTTNKEQMQEKVLNVLKGLIPFLDEGLCYCESATPLTYEKFTARPGGIVNSVPQTVDVIGNKALSKFTCYRDLFLINDCTSPGLGVEGICQESLDLTDSICKRYE
ncbi:MAG: phytoene desaturase family protein [bacterium]